MFCLKYKKCSLFPKLLRNCDKGVNMCVGIYNYIHILVVERLFMEKTFLMVKPDGVQRDLIGEIVARFEEKGFQLVGGKLMSFLRKLLNNITESIKKDLSLVNLVDFITSGPGIRNGMGR